MFIESSYLLDDVIGVVAVLIPFVICVVSEFCSGVCSMGDSVCEGFVEVCSYEGEDLPVHFVNFVFVVCAHAHAYEEDFRSLYDFVHCLHPVEGFEAEEMEPFFHHFGGGLAK